MYSNIAIGPADQLTETTYGTVPVKLEQLAFYLYPLFGLSSNSDISPWETNECIDALENLHWSHITTHVFKEVPDNPIDHVIHSVSIDAQLVRGSAYQEQTASEIVAIQGRFENWFKNKIGLGPIKAQKMLWSIFQAQQKCYQGFSTSSTNCGKGIG